MTTMTFPDTVRAAHVDEHQLVRWRALDGGTVETYTPPEPTEPTPLDGGVYVLSSDLAAFLLGVAEQPAATTVLARDVLRAVAGALMDMTL